MNRFSVFSRLFRSRRRLLYSVVALVLVALCGVVYRSKRVESCPTNIPIDQDIKEAVAYGAAFEPALWEQQHANHDLDVSVLWRNMDWKALGHVDYLRYNCGLTKANMDQYAFGISLGGYDRWERTAQCERDGLRLHEFTVSYTGLPYHVRFWLKPASDTRLAAFQLSFPATQESELNTYSSRLFPVLSSCNAS